ncbi:MAG: adenylosuccinate synthetase [Bifidobacteriaceae bacterium]|jgi:adenylosuccinate synthase|nr:adenylosuccinate synthetase [Bifidobacteriaceae bacterium]
MTRTGTANADIVVGLGWGDESKGAAVDALAAWAVADGRAKEARVVRFNGGPQAAHNVRAGGRQHTFSSFGSGTFAGLATWLSSYCLVEPVAAAAERSALAVMGLEPALYVDADCLVTTPLHVAANLAREAARGDGRHGTTGRGIGETVSFSLHMADAAPRARDLASPSVFLAKARALADWYASEGLELGELDSWLDPSRAQLTAAACFTVVPGEQLLAELAQGYTIFEGAQGFWLDQSFGFQPHTTWSNTTPANARALGRAAGIKSVRTIGCIRTYATRHGAGPLPHEGKLAFEPLEPDNSAAGHAGRFRTALIDPDLLRAAIDQTMCNALAVSHLDVFNEFQTAAGPVGLAEFGPLAMTGRGPDRTDRLAAAA